MLICKNSTYKKILDNDRKERVQINQRNLEIADAYKYLGTIIDNELTFKYPIDYIVKKLNFFFLDFT